MSATNIQVKPATKKPDTKLQGGVMSLLDEVISHVATQGGGDPAHSAMATALLGMLQSQGGLQSMLQGLQSKGLGDAVASWVSTGANQSVTPDQMHNALGADVVAQLAQKAGLSPEVAKVALATVLPLVVDKLTPHGQVPQGNPLAEGLGGLLRKFV